MKAVKSAQRRSALSLHNILSHCGDCSIEQVIHYAIKQKGSQVLFEVKFLAPLFGSASRFIPFYLAMLT